MIRKFFSTEIGKLKKMSFAEKRWYIWAYYKLQIAILVFVIIAIGSLINTRFINPPPRDYLYIAWQASHLPQSQLDQLGESLSIIIDEELLNQRQRYQIGVRSYILTGDPQMDQALITRFHAMIQIGEIDILILPWDEMRDSAVFGVAKPIDQVMYYLQTLDAGIYRRVAEKAQTIEFTCAFDDIDITATVGIDLSNNPMLTELGFDTSDMFFSMAVTSDNYYQVAKALAALFCDL
ncbi:MAG: hypothetical protein FWE42_00840 [Defluviitaleaceae bacterium]|nr:hypothetical protein [Defluviitaleaceae bacterium]